MLWKGSAVACVKNSSEGTEKSHENSCQCRKLGGGVLKLFKKGEENKKITNFT
jgi:hypothetical protein